MGQRLALCTAPITVLLGVTSCASPRATAAGELLGHTLDQVVDRFGVPDEWVLGPDSVVLAYAGPDGSMGRFVFHDEIAVFVPATGFVPKTITPPPAERAWSGQPLADALARLGNPTRYSMGPTRTTFEYADGTTLTAAFGRAFVFHPGS